MKAGKNILAIVLVTGTFVNLIVAMPMISTDLSSMSSDEARSLLHSDQNNPMRQQLLIAIAKHVQKLANTDCPKSISQELCHQPLVIFFLNFNFSTFFNFVPSNRHFSFGLRKFVRNTVNRKCKIKFAK